MTMASIMEILFSQWPIFVAVAGYLLYRWTMAPFSFFAKRGIPFHKPSPLFGSMGALTLRQETILDMVMKPYNEFKGKRYVNKCIVNNTIIKLKLFSIFII